MSRLLEELLRAKVRGVAGSDEVVRLVLGNIGGDVEPYIIDGLEKVDEVILARPFTRYGWLLAIYGTLGLPREGKLIIYHNTVEPAWTASVLVHELIHVALGIRSSGPGDVFVDETLAYAASFRSGFHRLYLRGIRQAIEFFSQCTSSYEERDVLYVVLPRLAAHRLVAYDYGFLVKELARGPGRAVELWLETGPSEEEVRAFTAALELAGIRSERLRIGCRVEETAAADDSVSRYVLEGGDEGFAEMVRLLEEAARNRGRAAEILAPWWSELEEVRDELEAYLWIRGAG